MKLKKVPWNKKVWKKLREHRNLMELKKVPWNKKVEKKAQGTREPDGTCKFRGTRKLKR